ncbi:hypothetical protein KW843_22735 [Acidovorax sp. sif1233]|uniref:hypothetical protein n=1 Tax=Acidovorax sp. sif1233 TaxID=2854792 RepID=UPI001C44C392|nr:hypothetical protein [Acidovorax sp. sif1233]MBV7457315.1 hypothetical protein [Acidovorax sp. sif1233]
MKFVNIQYVGTTPYTDRTPLKNAWLPGEEKLVSERDARALAGYLEFKRVVDAAPQKAAKADAKTDAPTGTGTAEGQADNAALELAKRAQAEVKAREKKAKKQVEGTLLEVSRMSKPALGDYAKQNYGVELDLKSKVDDLRNQVTSLVQGGRP